MDFYSKHAIKKQLLKNYFQSIFTVSAKLNQGNMEQRRCMLGPWREATSEQCKEHFVMDWWAKYFWNRSHWEHIVGHEKGSWSDACPHTPLTKRAAVRQTISLEENTKEELKNTDEKTGVKSFISRTFLTDGHFPFWLPYHLILLCLVSFLIYSWCTLKDLYLFNLMWFLVSFKSISNPRQSVQMSLKSDIDPPPTVLKE